MPILKISDYKPLMRKRKRKKYLDFVIILNVN